MKLIPQIILMSLILMGASCDDDTNQLTEKETFVESVLLPDTVRQGESFEIEFEISVSGCWTYSGLEKEIDEQTTSFKIFINNPSKDDTRVNCPTGFFSETVNEQIILTSLGINNLSFNDSTLLKKIFVKD